VCHPVLCRICGKVTWSGCGDHVEQALAGIPTELRCTGHGERAHRERTS
jgi:hypothetical protein